MSLNKEKNNINEYYFGENYRTYVGPPERHDYMGSNQFRLLTALGLRSKHKLLDFGCGSLRAGKLFIPFLDKYNYFGQEPNQWLIEEAIKHEIGKDLIDLKKPQFSNVDNFELGFKEKFDYIIANSIFSHCSRKYLIKGINSIYDGLNENGIAVITTFLGDEDYAGSKDWVYPDCTLYTKKTISNTLNENIKYWKQLYWFHPCQSWFILTKSKNRLPSFLKNFFLLGGEEINSEQFPYNNFFRNRLRNYTNLKRFLKFLSHR